jgi:hypothetical protein
MNGLIGLGLTFGIGTGVLNLSTPDLLLCSFVSILAGLISLLLTLQVEKIPAIRKNWLNRSLKTWTFLVSLYGGILLALAPPSRDFNSLKYLIFPLILQTGFSIILFGPIQDELVKRQQRKALRARASSA